MYQKLIKDQPNKNKWREKLKGQKHKHATTR